MYIYYLSTNGYTMKSIKLFSVCIFSALIMISCGSSTKDTGNDNNDVTDQGTMKIFADENELEDYMKEQFASAVVEMSFTLGEAEVISSTASGSSSQAQVNSDGSQGYSDTNVQESGVDESDKIKTDGNVLYVAQGHTVKIIKLEADKGMSIASEVNVGDNVDSLYLYKSILVALYSTYENVNGNWCGGAGESASVVSLSIPCWSGQTRTGVMMINVHDPAKPERIKNLLFDGALVSSRRINGMLHLISRYQPILPHLEYYYDNLHDNLSDVVKRNRAALEDVPINEIVPSFDLLANDLTIIDSGFLSNNLRNALTDFCLSPL